MIGREFRVELLERACELSDERLLGALDEAVSARIVDDISVGRYRFTNGLTRETLHEQLTPTRRARLHMQIAEAMEEMWSDRLDPHVAELAYHFGESGVADGQRKAIEYGTRAGERSMEVLAYEDAVSHYGRVLAAIERREPVDEVRRCEVLLAAGGASARAGDTAAAKERFLKAADIAGRLGAETLLARAALGYGGSWLTIGVVDQALVKLLEQALAALGDEDSALRARVLARLAVELSYAGDADSSGRKAFVSDQAVEMARRMGDTAVLAAALSARHYAIWDPDHIDERLAVATEIIEVGQAAGDKAKTLRGHHWRLGNLLELGRIEEVDREAESYARLAEELRQPFYRWWTPHMKAMRALLEGRFDDAEILSQEAWETGRRAQERLVTQGLGVQTFWLRRDQGRLEELEEATREFVQQYPAVSAWRCVLVYLYGELELAERARAEFEPFAADGFRGLPRDGFWLVAMTMLAEACSYLDDAKAASELHELLAPYANRNAVAGHVSACNGSVSRYLGLLATTLERWEVAARRFEEAMQMHAAMGARPLLARTQADYARMLRLRGAPRTVNWPIRC